jgi:hypothetical protein
MTDFETALDDCLKRLGRGETVDACLALYPEHAEKLRPLLKAANRYKGSPQAQPSATFAPGTKDAIYDFSEGTNRRRGIGWYFTPGVRWAALAIVLVLLLLFTIAAYAQSSYPGDGLYGLKLGSEDIARMLSPLQVDLMLSHRRTNEVLAVRNDPRNLAIAWAQYKIVIERLMAYQDPALKDRIQGILRAETDELTQAGMLLPTGAAALPPIPTVTPTPTLTATPTSTGLPPAQAPSATATSATGGYPAPTATSKSGGVPTLSFSTFTPAPTRTTGPSPTFPFPSRTPGPSPTFPSIPPPSFPTPCSTFPLCP